MNWRVDGRSSPTVIARLLSTALPPIAPPTPVPSGSTPKPDFTKGEYRMKGLFAVAYTLSEPKPMALANLLEKL